MYADSALSHEASGHRVAVDTWPVLVEGIASYLAYARRAYGVEPTLFSLNEPDIGMHVGLSPEEYADFVKQLGRRLAALGLKNAHASRR